MEEINDDSLKGTQPLRTKIQIIECAYCNEQFMPSKRWSHIYCTGSCRTLACRERRKGVSGTLEDKVKSTSVTDLYHSQEALFNEMKDLLGIMNFQMQQMMLMTNQIKLAQEPERIKDIDRRLNDWQSKGISSVPEQIQAIQLKLFKIELSTGQIAKSQSQQVWVTVLASVFGPMLGEQIWGGVKKVVTGKKEVPIEDRISAIMEIVTKMSKA